MVLGAALRMRAAFRPAGVRMMSGHSMEHAIGVFRLSHAAPDARRVAALASVCLVALRTQLQLLSTSISCTAAPRRYHLTPLSAPRS